VKAFAKSGGKRILCRDTSSGSIFCLKYLKKPNGSKWRAGVDVASECDIVAFNDYVINIYWPQEFKQIMVDAFNLPHLEEGMKKEYDYVLHGTGAKAQVPVAIIRDATIAKQIIKDTDAALKRKRA